MEMEAAVPKPPSAEDVVMKDMFEAQLKEYLAAAGPKSKLMNKARYDQTIQIVESEKGQTTGCRHSCCRN
jgi:hypothetical protein